MSLKLSEKQGDFKPIDEGIHLARCISIIDLWTQAMEFKGQAKDVHQIMFTFELPNETYEFEKDWEKITWVKLINKVFTASLNSKSTLRKFLKSWRGRDFTPEELAEFDLVNVLWKACQLQIMHSDDGKYANIDSVMNILKGTEVPENNKTKWLSLDEKEFNQEVYDSLSEKMQEKIAKSPEYQKLFGVTEEEVKAEFNNKEFE